MAQLNKSIFFFFVMKMKRQTLTILLSHCIKISPKKLFDTRKENYVSMALTSITPLKVPSSLRHQSFLAYKIPRVKHTSTC